MKVRALTAILALGLLASAGGGGDDTSSDGGSASPSDDGMDMGEHGSGSGTGAFSFGEPADLADADRVISVTASDDLTFDPAEVNATMGETIEFEVSNPGAVAHEFVIGDDAFQAEHEGEMADMSGHMDMLPGDMAYAISLEPGETKSIAWTFSSDGVVEYGCHVRRHYEAGMVGRITVERV